MLRSIFTSILLMSLLSMGFVSAEAQEIKNRVIAKVANHSTFQVISSMSARDLSLRVLSPDLNLVLIEKTTDFTANEFKELSYQKGMIQLAYDQKVEKRDRPDDAFLNEQWALDKVRAYEAWELLTGGQTANGEQVVVAVIDDGFDMFHEDLRNRFFVFPDEIPNNNRDDDSNGRIDDVQGLNVDTGRGDHESRNHGTSVSGIIGAEGNNGSGIAGINWDVRILPISGINNIGDVIEAYQYILSNKRLFLTSNGTKGANILVSNYSGGVENAFPDEFPFDQWCELYDLMGNEGILSVGSTSNKDNKNIDQTGDMPSTCSSEFFLAVTNSGEIDELVDGSGFGATHIDLAAPGFQIYTTRKEDRYQDFTGTSAAAPMVAGTAALLYSVQCDDFGTLLRTRPDEAALAVRDAILEGARITPIMDMLGKSTTGGRLNVIESLIQMQNPCQGTLDIPSLSGPLEIRGIQPLGNDLLIDYITPDLASYQALIHNSMGSLISSSTVNPQAFGGKFFLIDTNQWITGVYFLTIFKEGSSVSYPFFYHR